MLKNNCISAEEINHVVLHYSQCVHGWFPLYASPMVIHGVVSLYFATEVDLANRTALEKNDTPQALELIVPVTPLKGCKNWHKGFWNSSEKHTFQVGECGVMGRIRIRTDKADGYRSREIRMNFNVCCEYMRKREQERTCICYKRRFWVQSLHLFIISPVLLH